MAAGRFAVSGLRVFGNGNGQKPGSVQDFTALRTFRDKRSAWLKWRPVDNAYAYIIRMGTEPDKLYTSIMVYGSNEYWLKALDLTRTFYFSIESINENGISEKSAVLKAD